MTPPHGLFVAGTDTEVGKTFVTVALVRALVAQGTRVAVMKPVAAGATDSETGLRNDDALALISASNVIAPYDEVNPYCFALPASPHLAARDDGATIDPDLITRRAMSLATRADAVVVEGAGGWLSPIGERKTMADIAVALKLPVLLVVGMRLGCLNHALLTVESIRARGLELAGWVANTVDPRMIRIDDNVAELAERLAMPPLALIPWSDGAEPPEDRFASAAAGLAASWTPTPNQNASL